MARCVIILLAGSVIGIWQAFGGVSLYVQGWLLVGTYYAVQIERVVFCVSPWS